MFKTGKKKNSSGFDQENHPDLMNTGEASTPVFIITRTCFTNEKQTDNNCVTFFLRYITGR